MRAVNAVTRCVCLYSVHPARERIELNVSNRINFDVYTYHSPFGLREAIETNLMRSWKQYFQSKKFLNIFIYGKRIPLAIRFVIRSHFVFVYSCDEAIARHRTKEFGGTLVALSGDRILSAQWFVDHFSCNIKIWIWNRNIFERHCHWFTVVWWRHY